MRRDYARCSRQTRALLDQAAASGAKPDYAAVLLHLISLERLGEREAAFRNAIELLQPVGDPWQQALMMLAIGRGNVDSMLGDIGEIKDEDAARKLWQFSFCLGAQYVSRHDWPQAHAVYQRMLLGQDVPPVSCLEMMLSVIEYNYLSSGSAGSTFDEAIVQLNSKGAQERNPSEQLKLALQAFSEAQKALGAQHPAYITAVYNVAAAYMNLQQYPEAEPYLKDAVSLRRIVFGNDSDAVVDGLKSLGMLYGRTGDRQKAGECYAEALEILERMRNAH
jgi:tetratricopeptide (TPR) repeat protein